MEVELNIDDNNENVLLDAFSDEAREIAIKCKLHEIQLVNEIMTGFHPSNTDAFLKLYPHHTRRAASQAVSRILNKPVIKELLALIKLERIKETILTKEELLGIYSDIARGTNYADPESVPEQATMDKARMTACKQLSELAGYLENVQDETRIIIEIDNNSDSDWIE